MFQWQISCGQSLKKPQRPRRKPALCTCRTQTCPDPDRRPHSFGQIRTGVCELAQACLTGCIINADAIAGIRLLAPALSPPFPRRNRRKPPIRLYGHIGKHTRLFHRPLAAGSAKPPCLAEALGSGPSPHCYWRHWPVLFWRFNAGACPEIPPIPATISVIAGNDPPRNPWQRRPFCPTLQERTTRQTLAYSGSKQPRPPATGMGGLGKPPVKGLSAWQARNPACP